jgi:hypothetical protein
MVYTFKASIKVIKHKYNSIRFKHRLSGVLPTSLPFLLSDKTISPAEDKQKREFRVSD